MTTPERKQGQIDFNGVVTNAQKSLLRIGSHQPTITVHGNINQVTGILPDVPETHEEKLAYMWALGQYAAEDGRIGELQQFFFVSSASLWEENEAIHLDFAPSQDSDRREILYIGGIDLVNHQKHLAFLEIIRDEHGQFSEFSDLLVDSGMGLPLETPLEDAFIIGYQTHFNLDHS